MSSNRSVAESRHFEWTQFYEAFADRLLVFKENRSDLVTEIHAIAGRRTDLIKGGLQDKFENDRPGPLKDICPFTTMGLFNRHRGTSNDKRRAIAQELARFLNVTVPAPDTFEGIPVVDARGAWFFAFAKDREPNAIDLLWEVFESAIRFARNSDEFDARGQFVTSYDRAMQVKYVAWNLTMGLFWIRPRVFQTCDSRSRYYIDREFGIVVEDSVKEDSQEYLALLDSLKSKFQEVGSPVRSYQELSYRADLPDGADNIEGETQPTLEDDSAGRKVSEPSVAIPSSARQDQTYSAETILRDGCFLDLSKIEEVLQRLRDKKNLILQGPPGTGKSWLARRLAYALIGFKDDSKVSAVQFHPNLSYEDFVRGWRPSKEGRLELVDGLFVEMIDRAKADPESEYVVVIEEINRGNPAQIFGEMLTLLEIDKRDPGDALALTYPRDAEERVFLPKNLYLIGTMNLADRSLALVDFALRRRFAFVELAPIFGESWSRWVSETVGIESKVLSTIGEKIDALNATLSDDPSLGPQFQVGHSFVTPFLGQEISDPRAWFRRVVETEIGPLLEEYWFDNREKAQSERERLLVGF